MIRFKYQAIDAKGKRQRGEISADSLRSARQLLQARAYQILALSESQDKFYTSLLGFTFKRSRKNTLKLADLCLVTRQLATLLRAGIPLDEVLAGVAKQQQKEAVRSVILGVRAKVMEGYSLAAAMNSFPEAFPALYRTTVAAGEKSAQLDLILERLADYTERQQKVRRKILQAAIYPSLMSIISVLVVVFMLTYIVPKILDAFSDTQQALPLPTQILLCLSHGLVDYGAYCALVFLLLGLWFFRALKKKAFRFRFDSYLLRVPLIGRLIKTMMTARFAHTLGILHAASVPVLEAMQAAGALITPLPMRQAIEAAILGVREGQAIHVALEKTGYFAPMFLHLLSSGERSGQLEAMLARAAAGQEADVEAVIDSSLALFEPIMILVMGAIVMFIVLAVMLPIFALNNFNM
jgi:general secretion pathway protein F